MPQLDIVHILSMYLWTWLTLTLISLKIKAFTLTTKMKEQPHSAPQLTPPTTPWT